MTFPISRENQRQLAPDWCGEVFVCDIDRTYLATRLSSLRGMARIPFEFAVDKTAIDGMAALLQEVRRGPQSTSRQTPLYFISASPAQLRPVMQQRMVLDGIEADGTTFKDWLGVLRSGHLRRLREQVGFKLTALLSARRDLPRGAREILIGDDNESDPQVFALYADILAGRLSGEPLLRVLQGQGVSHADALAIAALKGDLPDLEGVERACVRLDRVVDPRVFLDFAPEIAVCHGAFQLGLVLWANGSLSRDGVARVVRSLVRRGHLEGELAALLADACRRGLVDAERGVALREALREAQGETMALDLGGDPLPGVGVPWDGRVPRAAGDLWLPARFR